MRYAEFSRDHHHVTWVLRSCELSHFSCVQLCVTPWTVACQAPLSMEFSRQEEWSGLPCPPAGDLANSGIETASLTSNLHWQVGSLPLVLPGKPHWDFRSGWYAHYHISEPVRIHHHQLESIFYSDCLSVLSLPGSHPEHYILFSRYLALGASSLWQSLRLDLVSDDFDSSEEYRWCGLWNGPQVEFFFLNGDFIDMLLRSHPFQGYSQLTLRESLGSLILFNLNFIHQTSSLKLYSKYLQMGNMLFKLHVYGELSCLWWVLIWAGL